MVKIEFMAELAALAKTELLEVRSGETVSHVLAAVTERLGLDLKKRLFHADGSFADDVFILVNGQHIRYLKGLRTPLQENDTVTLIPFIEGG